MQIKCACCNKGISLSKVLFSSTSKLASFPCPSCKNNILLPWGVILSLKGFNILFFATMLVVQDIEVIQYELLLPWVIINIIFITTIYFIPIHCLNDENKTIKIEDKDYKIIEENMSVQTAKIVSMSIKLLFTIILTMSIWKFIFPDIQIFNNNNIAFIGIPFIIFPLYKLFKSLYIEKFWSSVNGTIQDSTIVHRHDKLYNDINDYYLKTTYQYSIDGKMYTSTKLTYNAHCLPRYLTLEKVTKKLKEHVVNGIKIFYNPNKKEDSCLYVSLANKYYFVYFCSFVFGLTCIWEYL